MKGLFGFLAVAAVAACCMAPATADAGGYGCCPPPPVTVPLCVIDPCTGCATTVCVCVPACCAAEQPVLLCCRRGLFGRKTLTYKYCCCGHTVDVLVTRKGRVRVR